MQSGTDRKVVKVLMDYSKETKIRIAGDPNEDRVGTVVDSNGQETNMACKGTSLSSLGRMTDAAVPYEGCDKIEGQPLTPHVFMDDLGVANKDAANARTNAERVARGAELLSLSANPEKSAILVTGGKNQKVLNVREELIENPVTLHGVPVKVKEKDP